jgi:hypothetical protein
MQQVTNEAINKSPSNKLDKGMEQLSSNATMMIRASEMEHERELNVEVGACREEEENSVTLPATAISINSEKKISEGSSETVGRTLVTICWPKCTTNNRRRGARCSTSA